MLRILQRGSHYGEQPTTAELAVPPDERANREEVVLLQGESESEGEMTGVRSIIRAENAKPRLGPLELERWTEGHGRMVGMLPRRTTVQ